MSEHTYGVTNTMHKMQSDKYDGVSVGEIRNYYGGLNIRKVSGKCYWGIEDWNDEAEWEEIPEYLYDALMKFRLTPPVWL